VKETSLIGQGSQEFEAEAEAIFRADDGGQVRAAGRIEFNLEQVARAEQDAGVKNHAAFAQLSTAAWNYSSGKAFGSHYFDWQINGQPRPAARLVGDKHSR
jgi:hypothetical protein